MNRIGRSSSATKLNVIGLVLAAAGMLLQIIAGSELYPTLSGPVILFGTAVFVAVGPGSWTRLVGTVVPLVLGVGAIVAAVMTGEFIDQLANTGNPAILLGSLMHALGLTAAVAGGVGMLLARRTLVSVER